ncbi:tyrosine-type recombinase/integrase [Kutzneria kofuensis]|uniref:Integrase n=1 Tax=Kutzneria kofuensis TaxID=103725 RepID=A0A7W9KDN8_9PSEU|nr:site-specific integrase [Kutzneria kofuensis]MBB5890651.1 integrase [Kutzneria kofuensis]
MAAARSEGRQRGGIEVRGDSLRVKVYAGLDPVTGKRVYLRETIKGTDDVAMKRAEKKLNELLVQVDKQRNAPSAVKLGYAIDQWLRTAELDDGTRDMYRGYVERNIRPVLGETPIKKVSARVLEELYAELRRCRVRCDGKPFVEHRTEEEHDCSEPPKNTKKRCRPHECRPLAASTVRQIHSIISGTLTAAVRWEWIDSNPARIAQRPKQKAPEPDPPSPTDAARLIDAAFELDEDWGVLVWLVMTTGIRRGEVCALKWSRVDLDEGTIEIRRSYTLRSGVGKEKDTKTHQMRRIALDTETTVLLTEYKERCRQRFAGLGMELSDDMYVFTGVRNPDPTQPYSPHAVSSRYKDMAERLGIKTHIHSLRHYSATELLTAGIDLRTVAGRLGHGGGGATTLRVYAAWVAGADRKAAEILGSRMPKRTKSG